MRIKQSENVGKTKQLGLAAIELTLVLPFLLLLVFATAEFGRMLYQYNALNHLSRDALRYVVHDVIRGDTQVDSTALANITPQGKNLLIYGQHSSSNEILPRLSDPNYTTVNFTITDDEYVTITTTYYWQPIFFSLMPSFVSNQTIDLAFPLVVKYSMRAL